MFRNYQRHKILKILNDRFNSDSNDRITYDFLCEKFNVDYSELRLIKSELTKNKEAVHCGLLDHQLRGKVKVLTHTNSKGLHITDEGINALSNRKYLKIIQQRIFKIIFQISIPLIITAIAVYTFINANRKTKEIQKDLQVIENRIILLEKESVSNTIQTQNLKDTLNPS